MQYSASSSFFLPSFVNLISKATQEGNISKSVLGEMSLFTPKERSINSCAGDVLECKSMIDFCS
jgi:hypothetical protein